MRRRYARTLQTSPQRTMAPPVSFASIMARFRSPLGELREIRGVRYGRNLYAGNGHYLASEIALRTWLPGGG
jgi:hypothetical protein